MKTISILLMFLFFASCGKKENNNDKIPVGKEEVDVPIEVIDSISEGKSLVEGSDCLACHKLDEKIIGPSFNDIAKKYENSPENIDLLANKIINGSSGVWGDVPMPPHGFSQKNARFMSQYILSPK